MGHPRVIPAKAGTHEPKCWEPREHVFAKLPATVFMGPGLRRDDDERVHFFTSSALTGLGAPACCGWAFSSPGRIYSAPSHGLMNSKSRKSWASLTGS